MPGKKDPEYFPINLNASGIGGFYGAGLNGPPHGKFEYDNSALNMSFNVSIPPPVNSEEDETDDESSSMTGSDIDVDMDTLVLSIREKLKMSPKFNTKSTNFWTESPPSSSDNSHNNSVVVVNNNFDSGSSNNNSNNISSTKRCRNHPYSQWRHSVHNNPTSHHHHTNYHHRQIINGGIQKQHKSNCHHHHWTSKSFNDISKTKKSSSDTTSTPHPYTLLQELIDSGSLIKEAVRRINLKQKRLTINPNSNGSLSSLVI